MAYCISIQFPETSMAAVLRWTGDDEVPVPASLTAHRSRHRGRRTDLEKQSRATESERGDLHPPPLVRRTVNGGMDHTAAPSKSRANTGTITALRANLQTT